MIQIFLFTTGVSSDVRYWPDPGDWNPANNTIEIIGAGGRGRNGSTGGAYLGSGPGGGGGAYAKGVNLNPTFPVPYLVGASVGDDQSYQSAFGSTDWVNGSGALVRAGSGKTTIMGNFGGGAGISFYPTGYSGGTGGAGTITGGALLRDSVESFGVANDGGGGGGGAGGPFGAGGAGVSASTGVAGNGGSSGGGQKAGGIVQPILTGTPHGLSGTEWGLYGSGSGGAGSRFGAISVGNYAGDGGPYGGGGGGGSAYSGRTTGGVGGPGLIVITYEPLIKPKFTFNMPMMGI